MGMISIRPQREDPIMAAVRRRVVASPEYRHLIQPWAEPVGKALSYMTGPENPPVHGALQLLDIIGRHDLTGVGGMPMMAVKGPLSWLEEAEAARRELAALDARRAARAGPLEEAMARRRAQLGGQQIGPGLPPVNTERPPIPPSPAAPAAYDYEKQRWVEGPEAERLAAAQAFDEAPLLQDPAYRAFIQKRGQPPIQPPALPPMSRAPTGDLSAELMAQLRQQHPPMTPVQPPIAPDPVAAAWGRDDEALQAMLSGGGKRAAVAQTPGTNMEGPIARAAKRRQAAIKGPPQPEQLTGAPTGVSDKPPPGAGGGIQAVVPPEAKPIGPGPAARTVIPHGDPNREGIATLIDEWEAASNAGFPGAFPPDVSLLNLRKKLRMAGPVPLSPVEKKYWDVLMSTEIQPRPTAAAMQFPPGSPTSPVQKAATARGLEDRIAELEAQLGQPKADELVQRGAEVARGEAKGTPFPAKTPIGAAAERRAASPAGQGAQAGGVSFTKIAKDTWEAEGIKVHKLGGQFHAVVNGQVVQGAMSDIGNAIRKARRK